jgi:hypothetical protein
MNSQSKSSPTPGPGLEPKPIQHWKKLAIKMPFPAPAKSQAREPGTRNMLTQGSYAAPKCISGYVVTRNAGSDAV